MSIHNVTQTNYMEMIQLGLSGS